MSIAPGALWKNAMIGSLGAMSTGDGSAAICRAPSASGGDATTAGAVRPRKMTRRRLWAMVLMTPPLYPVVRSGIVTVAKPGEHPRSPVV